ncbi:DUF58 domain-containing protein [Thermogemmatispora carboxidivorans]|uniref:DUF58 domain-containing protein n=1 Tax=Thermogemmatispora carboxidivorans TaxID=1382306 RepID=UPI00069C86A4|nr:DUF58 domain-containing protein [Thermogemmatispora carboxidivorans]
MKRSWYFLALGVLVASVLFRQLLLLIVGLLLLLILLLIDVWGTFCLVNLRYQRAFSQQRASFGEEIVLTQVLENAKLLPLPWVEVSDRVPLALVFRGLGPHLIPDGGRAIIESLFSPRWYERIARSYRLRCLARGVHTFGPTVLRSGDLFGFVSRRQELDNREQILVYPPLVSLTRLGLPARHPFGERPAPQRLLEDPARVYGIRDYCQGDELRRVHWKASARAMRLQSKVYEASTTYTLALFLDMPPALSLLDLGVSRELQELAICAAASVADWGLQAGYAVGLYCNGMLAGLEGGSALPETLPVELPRDHQEPRSGIIRLPPASGARQRQRILEALARAESHYGKPIEAVLQAEHTHLPFGATVILVTSTISEALLSVLQRLQRSGHPVSLLYIGQAPVTKVPGVLVQHIGGEGTWRAILASFERGQDPADSP